MKTSKLISVLLALSVIASAFNMTAVFAAETASADDAPAFSEDFSSYTAENVQYTSESNALIMLSEEIGNTVIATNPNGGKWITSSLSRYNNNGHGPKAYFNLDDNYLAVKGYFQYYDGAVKLSLPHKVYAVKKMTFTTQTTNKAGGVKLFLNEKESDYLFVGQWINDNANPSGLWETVEGDTDATNANQAAAKYQPFVYKKVNRQDPHNGNGTTTKLAVATDWPQKQGKVDWTVEIMSDWTVKITAKGSEGGEFTYTVDDDQVKNMVRNTAYPMEVFHNDDAGETRLFNANVWYDIDEPDFWDDFSEYTADNLGHSYTSSANSYLLTGGAKTIATHSSGAKWTSSKFYIGSYDNSTGGGTTYVDVANKKLAVQGWGNGWSGAVNLDLGQLDNVEKLQFTTTPLARGGGALCFIGEDEKTAIVLGQQYNVYDGHYLKGMTGSNLYNVFVNITNGTSCSLTTGTNLAVSTGWESTKDTSVKWTVTVSDDNVMTVEAIGNKGGYFKTTINNETVKNIISNARYTLAPFGADNNGYTTIDNVGVWYTPYVEPAFEYDFAAADITSTSSNPTYIDFRGKQLIAEDSKTGAKWYTSERYAGLGERYVYGESSRTSLNSYFYKDNGSLKLRSVFQNDITANLDYPLTKIDKISVVTGSAGEQTGFRFMVNENEKTYYELRYGRYNDGQGSSWANTATELTYGTPRFVKVVNGTVSDTVYCSGEAWKGTGSDYTWTVKADGNKLDMKVISGSKSWEYTYTDESLADMIKNTRYPIALVARGDGATSFKKVTLWGTPVYDVLTDNGDGTVTVTVQDGIYDSNNINAVAAFYDADGNMIKSETVTSDGTALKSEKFDKNGAVSVKAFVFDGDPKDGKLLNAVNYEGTVSDKAENPIRVACVGDSLTEGNGSSNNYNYSYPAQLQRLLGRGYEVKNFGKGSATVCSGDIQYTQYDGSYVGLNLWDVSYNNYKTYHNLTGTPIFADSKSFNPDIAVIQLGTNDRAVIGNAEKQTEFKKVYGEMIDDYQALGAEVYVVVPPIAGDAGSAENQNILNYIKPILEEFVKTKGVKMVNMQYGPTTSMRTDSLHFNDTGYGVMAQLIYDAITGKVEYSHENGKVAVKPSASIYGTVISAAYGSDGLDTVAVEEKAIIQPNVETKFDVSGTNAKFMVWDGVESMKPIAKISESFAGGKKVAGNTTEVTGKTEPNASVVIAAYDASDNLIYVNNVLTDYDSNYSFSFAGAAETVYINGASL